MAAINQLNRRAIQFQPNSPLIIDLPLGGKMTQGWVILKGTVILSGVSAAGTLQGEGAPVNLIKRITVTATPAAGSRYPGGDVVKMTPRALLRQAVTQRDGGKYVAEQAGSTLGNGANGTYVIYLAVPIFFADSNNRKNEFQTALNCDLPSSTPGGTYSSVQVRIDTGDMTSCFAGWAGTVNFTGLQVQWKDYRIGTTGDTLVLYQEDHEMLLPATTTRQVDEVMPQNGAFLSWLILQEASAARTLSNALLNRVTIQAPTLSYDQYAGDIYQDMLDNGWIDAAQSQTGQLFIDFTGGYLANIVPAGGIQAEFDVNNVSGANLDLLRFATRRVLGPNPVQQ